MVDFTPLHTWHIGEENTIEYTLPSGFDEHSSDWIGIYKVNTRTLIKFDDILYAQEILSFHHGICKFLFRKIS